MQRGRGGRDDFFGSGDPFGGFGGFGGFDGFGGFGGFGGFDAFGRPGSLVTNFFGGTNPFDDPFFSQPFGGMMGPSLFGPGGSIFGANSHLTHGGFLQNRTPQPNRSMGPVIKELNSDGEEDEEEEKATGKEQNGNPRKHLRSETEPFVQEPDEDAEERRSKQLNSLNGVIPQNNSYFFQSSTVSYGGPNGTYYTSSAARRAGGDGVVMEEHKEADLTTGKATHMVSRGVHNKGHSVTRKLNSDGRVDTLQALHNLNEDELADFDKTWKGKARQYLPELGSAIGNGNIATSGGYRHEAEPPSRRMALPYISQAQPQGPGANGSRAFGGQTSSSGMVRPSPTPTMPGRANVQTRPNPTALKFHGANDPSKSSNLNEPF